MTPAEIRDQAALLEAEYGPDLEPRAAAAALNCDIILPFFLAACALGLGMALSDFFMRWLEGVLR
ncbi:MAG: hypothetical protein NTY77_05460 [Elusimicrobia bacterium]|nr:hypothetical protein [Elusimicrobiota bacterium]